MAKFNIVYTKAFEKSLKRLSSEEQKLVASKLKILQINPYHPSLRTKKIHGFENLFECSVNMDIRIFWRYMTNDIIITLDVGHHSKVDKL